MNWIRLLGFIGVTILSILLVTIDPTKNRLLIVLAVSNILIVFLTNDLWDWIIQLKEAIAKKIEFKNNYNLCVNSSGKYSDSFRAICFKDLQNVDIISIIERVVRQIGINKYPQNVNKQNALRASIYHEIHLNTKDLELKAESFSQVQKILSQYNFRSSQKESSNDFLNAFAIEKDTAGSRYWKRNTLTIIKELIPTLELFQKQQDLNQLTRFKDFLKAKFSAKFTAANIVKTAINKGDQRCYWIIAKNVSNEIKNYLLSFPIFSIRPGKSHNFPGLDPIIFTHYLIRIEDYRIKNSSDLIRKLESFPDNNPNLLLFILPIQPYSIEKIESTPDKGTPSFFKHELAKKTIQYYINGLLELPIGNTDFESAINSGFISLEEIVQVIPLSFLIKKVSGIKPEYFDWVGEQLKEQFQVNSITDWKGADPIELARAMIEIDKSPDIGDYFNTLSKRRIQNICDSICKNADDLESTLNI